MNESSRRPEDVYKNVGAAAAARLPARARDQSLRELLRRMERGDCDGLASLYDATSQLIFSLAFRILGNRADAEEITLDVYVQVWKDPRRFDPTRGTVSAWLAMMVRSRALDRYRSQEARRKREEATEIVDKP